MGKSWGTGDKLSSYFNTDIWLTRRVLVRFQSNAERILNKTIVVFWQIIKNYKKKILGKKLNYLRNLKILTWCTRVLISYYLQKLIKNSWGSTQFLPRYFTCVNTSESLIVITYSVEDKSLALRCTLLKILSKVSLEHVNRILKLTENFLVDQRKKLLILKLNTSMVLSFADSDYLAKRYDSLNSLRATQLELL